MHKIVSVHSFTIFKMHIKRYYNHILAVECLLAERCKILVPMNMYRGQLMTGKDEAFQHGHQ